jgi:phosphorylcholine metabolism protein LicD
MDVTKAAQSLLKLKHDLDERGVDFWLREGTLLAAVRDGEFFEWEHDIDISVRVDDWPEGLDLCGWAVGYKWLPPQERLVPVPTQRTLMPNPPDKEAPNIDVMMQFLCRSRDEYITLAKPFGGSMRTAIPRDFMDTPNYINFYGEQFRIPRYPEMVLQSIYGDWRTPYKGESGGWRKNWGEWR